jgi:hypothetical protein
MAAQHPFYKQANRDVGLEYSTCATSWGSAGGRGKILLRFSDSWMTQAPPAPADSRAAVGLFADGRYCC